MRRVSSKLWLRSGLCALGLCWTYWAASPARARADDARAAWPQLGLSVGMGPSLGVRRVAVPERDATHRLSTRPYPGLDFALRIDLGLSARLRLMLFADYDTSVGLRVSPSPLAAADAPARALLRLQTVRAGVAPGYRFGASERALGLRIFAGWFVHGLRAVTQVDVPAYTLHGPMVHPELELPVSRGLLTLRAGPELAWIVSASRELSDAASLRAWGLGFGGQFAADLRVVTWSEAATFVTALHVVATYRVTYLRLGSAWDGAFSDMSQLASLRVALHY